MDILKNVNKIASSFLLFSDASSIENLIQTYLNLGSLTKRRGR